MTHKMTGKFWKNKKILVVGGAGFIGSHTADALIASGARVAVADDLSTGRRSNVNPKAVFYRADFDSARDMDRIFIKERPEMVLNFAASVISVPRSIKEPYFAAKSISGLANVLEHARRFRVKKVLHASSGFIYGNAKRYPTPENESLKPFNPYCIAKIACEYYMQFFHDHYGLPVAVLRYSNVYGPRRRDGALPAFIRDIDAGRPVALYGHGKSRDHVYISDVVRANLRALERPLMRSDAVFNISSGRELTLEKIHAVTADFLRKKGARPKYFPGRSGEATRFWLDNRKAKRILGWKPEVSFEDGLRETIRWFRDQRLGHAKETYKRQKQ